MLVPQVIGHSFYWTKGSDHPIPEWWSQMTGFLYFLAGPFLFDAPMESHLKQTMVAMTGILIMFSIVFGSPDECVKLTWWPQVALQVVLCGINHRLIAK